jgi:hypothetical protein
VIGLFFLPCRLGGTFYLMSREQNPERSVAREDAQGSDVEKNIPKTFAHPLFTLTFAAPISSFYP